MSTFDTPSSPYYLQGWNAWLMESNLTEGDTLCPYISKGKKEEWWRGYKAASYHYKGDPWKRAALKHGLEL